MREVRVKGDDTMSRYTGPKNKLSRREGMDLFETGKPSLLRRLNVPPGGGGRTPSRRKQSEYAKQLREKQRARRIYGLQEKQFLRYYKEAMRATGRTGEALLSLLERRLDNVIYRLGFARTRPMARQIVNHGHVLVDGKKVNIPSYRVSPGQTITLTEGIAKTPDVQDRIAETEQTVPAWLERQGAAGRVLRMPAVDEMEQRLDLGLIVEYYSR